MDEFIPSLDAIENFREFKQELFNLFRERFVTFYIHVLPHPLLKIGNRGLVGEEKESGIILIMGPRATKEYRAENYGFHCELQFGYQWEEVFIPWDAVFRVYDQTQFSLVQMRILPLIPEKILELGPETEKAEEKQKTTKKRKVKSVEEGEKGKVIRVDFGGKKE